MGIARVARHLVFGFAIGFTASSIANAAIFGPEQRLPEPVIAQFKTTPSSMLQQFPDGGLQLISLVRNLVASDSTTLPVVVSILKDVAANKDQTRDIVIGLAEAARLAVIIDQQFANEINVAIAATGNADVIVTYKAAVDDASISASSGPTGVGRENGNSRFAFGAKHEIPHSVFTVPNAIQSTLIGFGPASNMAYGVSPR